MLNFHIQETTGMYRMLICCIFAIVTMPALVTMDTVGVTRNIIGYVGETIELRCFDPSVNDEFILKTRAVSWMYLFQGDCSDNPSYVTVARCAEGSWEYLSYEQFQLVGNDDSCGNGLAYIRSQEPGNFTYKCHEMSGDGIDVVQIIFIISIEINSSISPCFVKYVPPSQNKTFDFICIHFNQRGCLNEDANDSELFLQRNGVRITPDISMSNRIVARIGLENISSISQYSCINQNHSSPCVVDDVTLSNPVGITPIVNRVIEGGDATFECILEDGHGSGEQYEWRFSRHIEFSRMSSTASSTLKISDVKFEDDGVIVRCIVDVIGTTFYSDALLRIRTEGGSSTMASYSSKVTTNLLPLSTQLFNLTTASTSTQYIGLDNCNLLMMYFLIPVFGVLLVAGVLVLAVYCWTRDIPGRPSADATLEIVQI